MNPKVIVVLAGTNNVGTKPGGDGQGRRRDAAALSAIVEICRRKAPSATMILTAIFPRNDNMAVMPEIRAINANLATLADGKAVRFLDVNGGLADKDGRLFDGMMGDGLHPTLKGYEVWADGVEAASDGVSSGRRRRRITRRRRPEIRPPHGPDVHALCGRLISSPRCPASRYGFGRAHAP